MPTSTSRLGIPVPVSTDPANVPSDMLNLADALDEGANANYSGAVVFVDPPGVLGNLPASPVKGTIYSVNSSPPYLLYYTGESTTPTATAPGGYRIIGQAGTNVANVSSANPGQSALVGAQPVWAPLDHQHATVPWGTTGQVGTSVPGDTANGGSIAAYARVDHRHAREAGNRTATINAVHATTPPTVDITTTIGSVAVTGVPFLSSYHPAVSDLVYVAELGGGDSTAADLIVLGPALALPFPSVSTFLVHTGPISTQSIPYQQLTACTYDTVTQDTDSGYNSTTGIYTVQNPGTWLFIANMMWQNFAVGVRLMQWGIPSLGGAGASSDAVNVDAFGRASISTIVQMTANQQVSVDVFQDGFNGPLFLNGGGGNNFSGTRLHA